MTEYATTVGLAAAAPVESDGLSKPFAVLATGTFKRKDFGTIKVTTADLDKAVENFDAIAASDGGQGIPIDVDHSWARGGTSKAVGWIKSLKREGTRLLARVAWTPVARAQIESGEFRKFSPEFTSAFKDEAGNARGFALVAGALTNRPHIRSLTVALDEGAATTTTTEETKPMNRNPFNVVADHVAETEGIRWVDAHARVFADARALAAERGVALAEAAVLMAEDLPAAEERATEVDGHQITDGGYGDGTQVPASHDLEAVQRVADENGVSRATASELMEIDDELHELTAPPQANGTPWLDARPLKEAPRPWSDEDWQRDQRRALVAGVTLNHDTWTMYAETGQDGVSELARGRNAGRVAQLKDYRVRLLADAQAKETARRVEALTAAKQRAAEERRKAELRRKHGDQVDWLNFVPVEDVARAEVMQQAFAPQAAPAKGRRK